jgi:(hydroxyamino)benzene mutase
MTTQNAKAVVHPSPMSRTARRLIALGALLFFLGLLAGLAVPVVTNPRMGLSAHLEAVMNGMFLIAVGAAWSRLSLPPGLMPWTSGLLSFGTYANCLFVGLAAVFGASKTMPIAGAGYAALPWQESLVTLGLTAAALAMLAGSALLVWGFFRREDSGETGTA